MRKFPGIRYFQSLSYLYFTVIKSVEAGIEIGVKDIKIGRILGERCIDKISWYLELLYVFNEILSISLLRFLSILITKL